MAIESKIIFAIGSKSIGGFTELKSAIDLMGQLWGKVKESTKELDQFSQMWQRTNQAAVLAADSAAGGLVDTTEVLRGYNKLMQSGAKVTDEQFKIITARAAEMAQATGTDATEAFKRLTNDISKGTTRSLKEYGVSIKTSTDLTKTQKDAIDGLTKGYEGLIVKAETTTERMFALENNLGTISGLMYNAMGSSAAFGDELDTLNKALGEFSTWLAESPNTMTEFMFSLDGMTIAAKEAGRRIIEMLAGPFIWIEEKINSLGGITGKGSLQQAIDDLMKTSDSDQALLDEQFLKRGEERKAREAAGIGTGKGLGRRRGRGGGGGGKKGKEMVFSESDVDKFEEEQLDQFFGAPSNDIISQLDNEALAERIELMKSYTQTVEEKEEAEQKAMEDEIAARERLKELAREEAEEQQEAREKEKQQAAEIREAWLSTFDSVSAGAQKQNKWIGALSKAVGTSIDAAVNQEKTAGAAIVNVLGEVGSAISEEAGWQAAMEAAKAVASAASQQWAAAAGHAAAAVAFGVVAATAGSGGGGGKSAGAKLQSQSERQRFTGGGGPDLNAQRDSGGKKEFTVNIAMKEGAGGWFDAIVDENDRASIDGRRNFSGGN